MGSHYKCPGCKLEFTRNEVKKWEYMRLPEQQWKNRFGDIEHRDKADGEYVWCPNEKCNRQISYFYAVKPVIGLGFGAGTSKVAHGE